MARPLTYGELNEVRCGDFMRGVQGFPGGADVTGRVNAVHRFGTQEVLAVEIEGQHFDRALSDLYRVDESPSTDTDRSVE